MSEREDSPQGGGLVPRSTPSAGVVHDDTSAAPAQHPRAADPDAIATATTRAADFAAAGLTHSAAAWADLARRMTCQEFTSRDVDLVRASLKATLADPRPEARATSRALAHLLGVVRPRPYLAPAGTPVEPLT